MISKLEAREALTGPIPTLRTPFLETGQVDYKALQTMIDFDIQAGARAVVLTAGDSHLIAMSDQEIAQVTKAVAEHARGRALVVAADRYYDTKQATDFAQYAAGVGADILMVMPPDWGGSCTPENIAEHYAAVARHIPVMIVTNIFSSRGMAFGLESGRHGRIGRCDSRYRHTIF